MKVICFRGVRVGFLLVFVPCVSTVRWVSSTGVSALLAVDESSVRDLSSLTLDSGSVVLLRGDVWDWGELVGCFADGEVRSFAPEDGAWRVEELMGGPVRASLVASGEGVVNIVVTAVESLSERLVDRLLKLLEESGAVFWLCADASGSVPATLLGRCSARVEVRSSAGARAESFVSAVSGCGAGEAARAVSLMRGRVRLAARVAELGAWREAECVSGSNLFRCYDREACREFVSSFVYVVSGKRLREGARFSSLPADIKRLVRAELSRWFVADGVVVSCVADGLVAREWFAAVGEFRDLVRVNVDPVDALSVVAFG